MQVAVCDAVCDYTRVVGAQLKSVITDELGGMNIQTRRTTKTLSIVVQCGHCVLLDLLVQGAACQQHQATEQLLEGNAALLVATARSVQPVGKHRRHALGQYVLQECILAERISAGSGRLFEGVANAPDFAVRYWYWA